MFEYFKAKLGALLDSVLAPFWSWVMAAPLWQKVLILLIGGGVGGAVAYPQVPWEAYSQAEAIMRAWGAEPQKIPLPNDVAEKTRATGKRLSQTVRAELLKLTGGSITPWAASQAAAAAAGMESSALDKEKIAAFIRSNTVPGCACWTEQLEKPSDPRCIFISGWVMFALAEMGAPATSEEIHYVLEAQTVDGWWPIFEGANQTHNASTYSTAWILIGLLHQRSNGSIDKQYASEVDDAIEKATGWLFSTRAKGARWKPYPRLSSSVESQSISGLVLHALHLAAPDRVSAIDKEWIEHLPITATAASDGENYYVEMEGTVPRAIDHFVQIKVPWMLIATVDAYPSGDLFQRAKALNWMEKVLSHDSVAIADGDEKSYWWRAELLYGLRYLLRNV
jgi:hypothetical protein